MAAVNTTPTCLVINEALCYISFNFTRVARSDLCSTVMEFYTFEEISAAKKFLFEFAASLNASYVPQCIDRKGDNRVRPTIGDLLTLFTLLDVNKAKIPQLRRCEHPASTYVCDFLFCEYGW